MTSLSALSTVITVTARRALPATEVRRSGARARRSRTARYRRRRTAASLAVAVLVGGGALVADSVLSGPGGVPASAAGTGAAHVERAVRAVPGDSLWSIAEEHRGSIGITRYVEELIDLNGGTRIEAGQLVRLP